MNAREELKKLLRYIFEIFSVYLINESSNKTFKVFYTKLFLNFVTVDSYSTPVFLNLRSYSAQKSRMVNQLLSTIEDKILSNPFETLDRSVLTSKSKVYRMNTVILIPRGWRNTEHHNYGTQGAQIEFLLQGLNENYHNVTILEIDNQTNVYDNCLKVKQGDKLDSFSHLDIITNSNIIFVWSLSILKPDFDFFTQLNKEMDLNSRSKQKWIGVITKSPAMHVLKVYEKWSKTLNAVVFYEENSPYMEKLRKIFRVIHIPIIPLTPTKITTDETFKTSVHFSGLLKQNRLAWLLTLRYQCIALGIDYKIIAISNLLKKKNSSGKYEPFQTFAEKKSKFGFGFVITHRDVNTDAQLIGSFWDCYQLGLIPIVQMQNRSNLSSYLVPFLDYFPVYDSSDLMTILLTAKKHPELFHKIRDRIKLRVQHEFNSKKIISDLLRSI